jgi:hypothetical protein
MKICQGGRIGRTCVRQTEEPGRCLRGSKDLCSTHDRRVPKRRGLAQRCPGAANAIATGAAGLRELTGPLNGERYVQVGSKPACPRRTPCAVGRAWHRNQRYKRARAERTAGVVPRRLRTSSRSAKNQSSTDGGHPFVDSGCVTEQKRGSRREADAGAGRGCPEGCGALILSCSPARVSATGGV